MPIVGHQAYSFWGWGADTGFTGSITINISPANISAQVGYHMLSGEGLHTIGIQKFRQRPTPDGPE